MPPERCSVPWMVRIVPGPSLKDYWNYREDLSVRNGLVLKGHRLIVPESLRTQMLSLVLQGHMGTEKCLLRAKDCLFWPGISKDIKELISNCSTCIKYAKQQPKERLLQYNLPSFPCRGLALTYSTTMDASIFWLLTTLANSRS